MPCVSFVLSVCWVWRRLRLMNNTANTGLANLTFARATSMSPRRYWIGVYIRQQEAKRAAREAVAAADRAASYERDAQEAR